RPRTARAGPQSFEIFRESSPWMSRRWRDSRRAAYASAETGEGGRRAAARRPGATDTALGTGRPGGELPDAAWHHPRPGDLQAPAIHQVLRPGAGPFQ